MSSETPDPRRWIALILLCATQFMLIIDVSIVNVALPTIEVDLDFTNSSLQWVASAYALTFGGFLLLGGRCADLLGRRRLFMAGLAVFTIASLACGFAIDQQLPDRRARGSGPRRRDDRARGALDPLDDVRRGQRAQQGAGRVGRRLRRRRSGGRAAGRRAHASTSAGNGSSSSTRRSASRAILLAPRLLNESRVEDAVRSFDLIGAVLVTASLSLLVYTVVKTDQYHWFSARTLGFFAVSAVLMVAFLINEQRASSPLLPLSIFRLPTIVGANVVGFMLGAAIFSMFFLLALYMQQPPGLDYSAIRSGVGYLLVACTIIVSAGASQALVGRFGVRRVLILGLVLLTAGLLFFTQVSPHGIVPRRPRARLRARGHRSRLRVHPGHDRRAHGHHRRRGRARVRAHQHVSADRRRRRRRAASDRVHQPDGRAPGRAATAADVAFTDGLSRAFLVGAVMAVIALVAAVVLVREGSAAEVEVTAPATETVRSS